MTLRFVPVRRRLTVIRMDGENQRRAGCPAAHVERERFPQRRAALAEHPVADAGTGRIRDGLHDAAVHEELHPAQRQAEIVVHLGDDLHLAIDLGSFGRADNGYMDGGDSI